MPFRRNARKSLTLLVFKHVAVRGAGIRAILIACFLSTLNVTVAHAEAKKIGIVVRSWEQGRFTDLLVPVIEAAAQDAGFETIFVISNDDIDQQAADVAALVAQGVDGIVIGLVNSDAGPTVGAAAAAGEVPLVYMNVAPINADQLPETQAYVGPDEYDVGRAQALAVCAALSDGGQVGLLIGDLLHPAAAARTRAVQDTIRSDACNGVTLAYEETAQWNREFASEVTSEWLATGDGLDAVIANNDPMGLGAVDAIEAAGYAPGAIFVTSIDGQPEAMDAVRAGSLALTFLQDIDEQGQAIFTTLAQIIAGERVASQVLLPLTPFADQTVPATTDG